VSTYLDRIVARHRDMAAADPRQLDALVEQARGAPAPRGFRRALALAPELAVIAEIKRRSPSKGALAESLDPATFAAAYAHAGASCLSVLTDEEFFSGSVADLQAAREATTLPVLRKDFTVDPRDVADARLMGADAVLLIAAALDALELIDFVALAGELRLDALVEVHDEPELEMALAAGATLIGVNQRDLYTFEVDHERAERMANAIPSEMVKVAESGIRGGDDAQRLAAAGYDAILVGESLVTAADPAAALAALRATRASSSRSRAFGRATS
jgi:indole-3-glycerol phosphate synthase